MIMESTEPLNWTIKVHMQPKDIRKAFFLGLRPSIIWRGLLALIFGRSSLFSKPESEIEELYSESIEQSSILSEPIDSLNNNGASDLFARLTEENNS